MSAPSTDRPVNSPTTGLGVALAGVATVGPVLSVVKVALGPAAGARLPTLSDAVPAAMPIPRLPSPVMFSMVTICVTPVPETATVPLAVPVVFRVTLPGLSVLPAKNGSTYVTVYSDGPPAAYEAEGALITTLGTAAATSATVRFRR